MKVGLCTVSGGDRPVEDVVELAADAGYDGVEVWGNGHVGDGTVEDCETVAETAAKRGVEVASYGSYLRCGDPDFEQTMEREVRVAERMGAETIRVWAGRQTYGDRDTGHWDAVVADLERVTERAGLADLSVTVERHANTLTDDREGARRLVEAVGDDRCGLTYQPLFSTRADELAREAADLAALSNQLHLQGPRERCGRERAPLSAVYYDLSALLDPFLDLEFDGYAYVEFVTDERPYREAVAADLAHLRSKLP